MAASKVWTRIKQLFHTAHEARFGYEIIDWIFEWLGMGAPYSGAAHLGTRNRLRAGERLLALHHDHKRELSLGHYKSKWVREAGFVKCPNPVCII